MKELIKAIIQLIKEYNQFRKDYKRSTKATLDYEALQRMVNSVSEKGVKIVIQTSDNTTIVIQSETKRENPPLKTFRERFMENRRGE